MGRGQDVAADIQPGLVSAAFISATSDLDLMVALRSSLRAKLTICNRVGSGTELTDLFTPTTPAELTWLLD